MKRSLFSAAFSTAARQQKAQTRTAQINKSLIHMEGRIGGELFGPVRPGGRREFFCLDENTWVWHEEWDDPVSKKRRIVTTRYDVRADGVLKSQGGQAYQMLQGQEAQNFQNAILLYEQRVLSEYNRMLSAA